MTGQLHRFDVAVLPDFAGELASEASGSSSPALSPDGRHAAYVSDRSGTPKVWVQPVGSELTFLVDTGEQPVMAVHWSTGGGWLACQIAPGGAPRHEVWLVRPDGSALHQVAGFGADTADNPRWLPGRSLLAVTENLTRLLVIDPVSGERRVLLATESADDLVSLFDVAPDFSRALIRRGPRGARHVAVRDLATGAEEHVASGEEAVFAPDGSIWVRSDAGEFPSLLHVVDGVATVVASSSTAEVESFTLTADGSRVAVLWNVHGGLSRVTVYPDKCDIPLPGLVVGGLSWSTDGSTLAFAAEGPGQPNGTWVWSPAEGVRPISADAPAPDAVAPTLVSFAAHDGLGLTGWLFRPAGDEPHPTVLWFHGGPEAQERPGHGPLFQSLVDRGIAVFAPNVRGSSGFGRTFVNADNGALRHDAIRDVESCVKHLVATGVADPARVGIMGRSYGGYLTLAALVTYPSLFAAGIDVCGMSNFATFYEHTEPWIAAAAVSKYGDPVHDADLLRELSPITRIDELTTPLMIVHGENDSNVPVIEAEQVVAALAERGREHRYLLFRDEGHELLHRHSRATYLQETVDWLSRYLLPPTD